MQTYKSNLLLDPLPPAGGGGGQVGFAADNAEHFSAALKALPEDLRVDPSLGSIKTFQDLTKSFVNAQKLIGTKRTALPDASWKPEQYAEFYKTLGRPDSAEGYKPSETTKLKDGIIIDDARMKTVRETFHNLGLSNKQGQAILDLYMGELNQTHDSVHAARAEAVAKGELALKEKWGDAYNQNVDVAKAVLKKFDGDGEIMKRLEATGLGNDPAVVGFFHSIGKLLMEDKSGGRGPGLQVQDSTRAAQDLQVLRQDGDFQKALFSREHPGHQAALEKWTLLHQQAFPKEA